MLEKMPIMSNKGSGSSWITPSKVSLLLLVFIFLLAQLWLVREQPPEEQIVSVVLPRVVVHIDLKGAPPKLTYLESLLPVLKEHGVNGLLMEYDDMFPYEGKLVNISSRNCYGKTELKKFLEKAAVSGFEIIPLVQTFGGMEHALKLQEFMHLRETLAYPNMICPRKNESLALVKNMLEQVIVFHSSIAPVQYIHVGFTEATQITQCEKCTAKDIFDMKIITGYLGKIAKYVQEKSSDMIILIWDDILRSVKPLEWDRVSLPKNLEVVSWSFRPKILTTNIQLTGYHQKCKGIWISSAFKGTLERTVPDLFERFLNNLDWMNFIVNFRFGGERNIYKFRGIILSGLSRNSHMDPLCELLPPSIPSLVLNLLVIKQFKSGVKFGQTPHQLFRYIDNEFLNYFNCDSSQFVELVPKVNLEHCYFEGRQLLSTLKRYEELKLDINEQFDNSLFPVEYHAIRNFINPNLVMKYLKWFERTLIKLVNVENNLIGFMQPYYPNSVIDEYVSCKTYSPKKKVQYILKKLKQYNKVHVWDRNPLNNITMINDKSIQLFGDGNDVDKSP